MVRTLAPRGRYTAHIAASSWWWFAAMIAVLELIAGLAGFDSLLLAGVLLIAPGFALSGLLPRGLRERAFTRACLAPALGIAATSVALTSLTRLGVPLTATSARATVAALILAGLFAGDAAAASPRRGRRLPSRDALVAGALDAAPLAGALAIALVLDWRVIGQLPVPGDDWAKYLLYADEIRRNGSLLIDNTLWMGGRPFSEDPGMPALEGAALTLTGAAAGGLVRTILLLSLLQVVGVYGAARAWFGRVGGFTAAALLAVVPASQNILGWHGLANVGALAIMVLVLAQLGAWLAGEFDRRAEIGLAITILGVAAAHRFTTLFLVGTLLAVLVMAAIAGPRGPLLRSAARTIGFTALGGILLLLDLQVRSGNAGGTLPYTSYLATKLDLTLALRDLTLVLVFSAAATVLVLGALRRLPRQVWPAAALAVVAVVLAFGWAFHFPLYYSRVTFFLPLPLALLAGAGAGALAARLTPRSVTVTAMLVPAVLAGAAGAVLGFEAVRSARQADQVRQYYAFASTSSLGALDTLRASLRPNETVATDRCWSFLATWLLHTRTYPALEEQDIQPKAELVIARKAAAILHGTPEGRELMRTMPVRYAVLDPTCPVSGRRFFPPGVPIFAGDRLAIIALDPDRANPIPPDRPRTKKRSSSRANARAKTD